MPETVLDVYASNHECLDSSVLLSDGAGELLFLDFPVDLALVPYEIELLLLCVD
jgi:hypothetical protein